MKLQNMFIWLLINKQIGQTGNLSSLGGGHRDFRLFGFSVLIFLDRFFGFCAQKLRFLGFGVHCGLRIFSLSGCGFRFFLLLQNMFIWLLINKQIGQR